MGGKKEVWYVGDKKTLANFKMWWSKQKGLQIEDLGSRIRSTHKKFRQIDRQTNRETDISSIRHTSHCYTFTIYFLAHPSILILF